jgi:hypothetical protein
MSEKVIIKVIEKRQLYHYISVKRPQVNGQFLIKIMSCKANF